MRRSTLAAALAAALLATAVPTVVLGTDWFTDVPGSNVFHDDVTWLAERSITRGCNPPENTEFCPEDPVTRQQMAAFMHRLGDAVLEEGVVGGSTSLEGQVASAARANAAYQDVEMAEAAGYAGTLDTLGCFHNPEVGGMGLHYLDETLMDATVDVRHPEALVYELDHNGDIAGLVAHEYIVPVDAWTESDPPRLFGRDFHQHPTLPLWVLHAWIWKDNPAGMFEDHNPTVRMCPDGVPIFGEELP
ncbi:MAG: S-layer homology domain-containing protein [Actinomycetota bacterium]